MSDPVKPKEPAKHPGVAQFDLVTNARDSLAHAVAHLAGPDGNSPGNLKIAVREVAHVVELLLKEKLSRVHPAFAWVKVDEYPSVAARTISTEMAVARLASICRIQLSPESCESIKACRRLRNQIEHFAFTLKEKEAQGIIGRLLSLIFDFSKRHLELDLETEFRRDRSWKALTDMVDFVEAHRKPLEERLRETKTEVIECSACGAETFVVKDGQCSLCDHQEELFECAQCHGQFKESEVSSVDVEDYGTLILCEACQGIGEPDFDYDFEDGR